MVFLNLHVKGRDGGFSQKSKRPKVDAVRQFPRPGGELAPKMDSRGTEVHVAIVRDLKNSFTNHPAPRKYPPPRILKDLRVKRDFPAGCGKQVSCSVSRNSISANGKSVAPKKNHPPRILKDFHVKRDFPAGCGKQNSCSVSRNSISDNGKSVADCKPLEITVLTDDNHCEDAKQVSLPPFVRKKDCLKVVASHPPKVLSEDYYQVSHCKPGAESQKWSVSNNCKSVAECKPLKINVLTDDNHWKDAKQISFPLLVRKQDCEKAVSSKAPKVLSEDYYQTVVISSKQGAEYQKWRVSSDKVTKALNQFRELFSEILREYETSSKIRTGATLEAAMILQRQYKWVNTSRRIGPVPGVEIGDTFQWRAELNVIGLHRQFSGGIDFMEKDGIILATSIVDSGRYANDVKSSDVLIYSGQGGNPKIKNVQPLDQKLERGNLALKNSMEVRAPVRVIRRMKIPNASSLAGASTMESMNFTFVYDGLYLVDDYYQERGQFGKLIFKFLLKRVSGQPKPRQTKLSISRNTTLRKESLCKNDLSQGKEDVPIHLCGPSCKCFCSCIYRVSQC